MACHPHLSIRVLTKQSDQESNNFLIEPKAVESWTRDGRFLLFSSTGPKTAADSARCAKGWELAQPHRF